MKFSFKRIGVLVFILSCFSNPVFAEGNSAEATATAKMRVIQRLSLENKSDLIFPDAYPGDPLGIVRPTEKNAAFFDVNGQTGLSYVVNFPAQSIFLTTAGAGNIADRRILVFDFKTDLTNNIGRLESGKSNFRVGASRAALRPTQVISNEYQGKFLVRVNYL